MLPAKCVLADSIVESSAINTAYGILTDSPPSREPNAR